MHGFISRFQRLFPFIKTIQEYSIAQGKSDFVAGLTVAVVASPQSMAYAMIAGVPPVYGLYASILPVIITALFGASRYLIAGPTNALCMVLYSSMLQITIAGVAIQTLPDEARLAFVFLLAIMTGFIQVVLGVSRLGHIANYISHSVIVAFTTGAFLLIVVGQIKNFFGLEFETPARPFPLIFETIKCFPTLNLYSCTLGVLTICFALFIKKNFPKIPYAITSLCFVSVLCAILGFAEKGVAMSPAIPHGLPAFYLPNNELLTAIPSLLLPACILALLASVESIAIGKSMQIKADLIAQEELDKEESQKEEKKNSAQDSCAFNANQELIAHGLGNIVGGLSSAIPSCGSFSRSAVNFTSGAKTRFSACISGVLTLFALLIFGPFVAYIPIASLAALLMLICWNMISVHDIRVLIKASKTDCFVFFITFFSVFILGLIQAIFMGIILSFGFYARKKLRAKRV